MTTNSSIRVKPPRRRNGDGELLVRWVRMVSPSSRGDHESHVGIGVAVLVLGPELEAS
jgi:hypothetical protein